MTKLQASCAVSVFSILLVICNTTTFAASDAQPQSNGFRATTRDQLLTECKRISIIPVASPVLLGVDPGASARIEAAGARALGAAGFDVVSAATYARAFDRYSRDSGGVYNPNTGAVRTENYVKAYQNAARELFQQDHVGCLALLRVMNTNATMTYQHADWDGVVEYVDGQANSGIYRNLLGSGGPGTLSALSIALKIFNQQDRELFSTVGGVQLTTYLDHNHGDDVSNFLEVPRSSWLKDDKRLDRAMNHATAALRYSADELASGRRNPAINTEEISPSDMPVPPQGSSRKTSTAMLVPREQIFSTVHRIVLGPLTLNGYVPGPDTASKFRAMVHERLAKAGFEVVDSDQVGTAFANALQQAGGVYDSNNGKYLPDRASAVTQTAIKALSLTPEPDGVALIALVRTTALQKYGNAAWDGTEQSGMTLGPAVHHAMLFGGTEFANAGEGSIAAVSLNLVIKDTNGTVLYDARGGIQLDQVLSVKSVSSFQKTTYVQQLANLSQDKLFKDPARNEHAVDEALRELTTVFKSVKAD